MNALSLIFAPLLPWPVLLVGAVLVLAGAALALWRGLRGWALRALAGAVLLVALAQPSLQREMSRALKDIVLIDDRTASQGLSDRRAQSDQALARVAQELAALPGVETRRIELPDAPGEGGSMIGHALSQALAEVPRAQLAGAILVSDGLAHDAQLAPDLPAPLHLLLSGHRSDWDRRLVIQTAPAFGIIGEPVRIRLRVEDMGAVPAGAGTMAALSIAIDGAAAKTYQVRVGQDLELPLTLHHGGQNVVQFSVAPVAGELTARNNDAVVQINGVRDRLRVLLVSGEPHAGERTWRNLLKSDAAVDLVHFTILRPPEKQDGVPVSELSLIAFPTRELFIDKIDQFDLIIFDRYAVRGILPSAYFANIARYVRDGGAVLVAAGPAFATAQSLWQTPLGAILPARPTGRVLSERFLPRPTELGLRHPVTAGLEGAPLPADKASAQSDAGAHWGRWLRQIELGEVRGETVLSGARDAPLLVLNRVGKGRVALLASDQAWLWDRGYEGGGPQMELLRRIAHWEMKEPELEEEALLAQPDPGQLAFQVVRRSMAKTVPPVEITAPDGQVHALALSETAPGRFSGRFKAPLPGLYRLRSQDSEHGTLERVVALGPASPREYDQTVASGTILGAAVKASGGAVSRIEDGVPALREIRAGRVSAGRGWIGITPRHARATTDIRVRPLLPSWAWLALAGGLVLAAWMVEGGRRRGGAR